MFTGLIETTGTLRRIEPRGGGVTLTIAAPNALVAELKLGDSVACDGACLTVIRREGDWFAVDASSETMERTTLGDRHLGDGIHLERALALGDRLGGHIVAGHVDGTGRVVSKAPMGSSLRVDFSAPPEVLRYLVAKGSICIDGVSLTVNTVDDAARTFSVVLIPHTQGVVTLHARSLGARVNLEADLLGKYVERLLTSREEGAGPRSAVDLSLLARTGFLKS